jgi:acyl-CoA synthetase (AMP-forming)/AMP-acid ligase II
MKSVPWSASLRVLAARFGEAPAVSDQFGDVLSYRALSERAHALAEWLAGRGMAPGAPIAILLPNSTAAVWVSYGVRIAGGAEAPLSWGYTRDEIAWAARLAQFRLVISSEKRTTVLRELGLETLWVDAVPPCPGIDGDRPAVPADAAGKLLFTSGTTGRPKGVRYSHGRRWLGEQLLRATLPFTLAAGSRILLVTPFPHGASLLTHAWCEQGGEVLLLDGADPQRMRELLRRRDIDAVFAPPTVIAKLAAAVGDERFEGVRCVFTGTQPLGATLYAKACALFGPVVRITYGKSECFNPITVLEPADTHAYFNQPRLPPGACVGWPAPGVEIDIRAG